jgi:hypothetical protein
MAAQAIRTFGDHLLQFAHGILIVTDEVYFDVLKQIEDHLTSRFEAGFVAVVTHFVDKVNHQPCLMGEYPRSPWWSEPMRLRNNRYTCQAAFAFDIGEMVWIVESSAKALNSSTSYRDLLNSSNDSAIPRYAKATDATVFTSIIQPLRAGGQAFGVMNIELKTYLEPVVAVKEEFEKIGAAIEILQTLRKAYSSQVLNTQGAKRRLEEAESVPVGGIIKMFLASSSNADDEVVGCLKETLDEFASQGKFKLDHWTEPAPGNITTNLWTRLSTCTYGACYLSEPSGTTSGYRDNPNVLFEAGVLYSLRQARRGPLRSILLVRERNAPKIPFDLSTEYMVYVPRSGDGRLQFEKFRSDLRAYLRPMFELTDGSDLNR